MLGDSELNSTDQPSIGCAITRGVKRVQYPNHGHLCDVVTRLPIVPAIVSEMATDQQPESIVSDSTVVPWPMNLQDYYAAHFKSVQLPIYVRQWMRRRSND